MDNRSISLLLVDDEPDFLATLGRRLMARQFKVATAENGLAALESLAREAVDVVVLDVRMPGLSGIEAIREIKKIQPMVEIIMLTGHADLEASIQGIALGAFDYLLKPAAIDDLVYKIQDAFQAKTLREKKARGHGGAPSSEPGRNPDGGSGT
jgi:DNA-binding NtrC family response regulator